MEQEHEHVAHEEHHESHHKKVIKVAISTKTAVCVAVVIVILALAWYFKGIFIAATVDGSPIWRLSVTEQTEKQSGKSVLDGLIAKKLVDQEETNKGITLTSDEINAAIKKIEAQVVAQGGTLADALSKQNMTMDDFRNSIVEQEKLKKLLGDKLAVSDEDVTKYIKDNKISVPEGTSASSFSAQVKDYLVQQKMGTEANALVETLKAKAHVSTFVSY